MSEHSQSYEELKHALTEEAGVKERLKFIPLIKGEILCQPRFMSDKYRDDYITLEFWGWELVLLPDGKYFINDTSG